MIKFRLTRDSVCAGDDAEAPHERVLEVEPPLADVMQFVSETSRGYLPSVDGLGHCWSTFLNGRVIATMTVSGVSSLDDELSLEPENEIYFKYHPANY
jgi:hypothetical protein